MKHIIVALLILAAGCASGPRQPASQRYARLDWARSSVEQSEAECYADINRIGGPGSLYLCMRAKGWQER
jgi:hypothetical protein